MAARHSQLKLKELQLQYLQPPPKSNSAVPVLSGLGVPDWQDLSASVLQLLGQAVLLSVRKSGKSHIIACSRDCNLHMKLALLLVLIRRQEISHKRTCGMKN